MRSLGICTLIMALCAGTAGLAEAGPHQQQRWPQHRPVDSLQRAENTLYRASTTVETADEATIKAENAWARWRKNRRPRALARANALTQQAIAVRRQAQRLIGVAQQATGVATREARQTVRWLRNNPYAPRPAWRQAQRRLQRARALRAQANGLALRSDAACSPDYVPGPGSPVLGRPGPRPFPPPHAGPGWDRPGWGGPGFRPGRRG